MKGDHTTNSPATSLIRFSLKGWENEFFELGSETVKGRRTRGFDSITGNVTAGETAFLMEPMIVNEFVRFGDSTTPTTISFGCSLTWQTGSHKGAHLIRGKEWIDAECLSLSCSAWRLRRPKLWRRCLENETRSSWQGMWEWYEITTHRKTNTTTSSRNKGDLACINKLRTWSRLLQEGPNEWEGGYDVAILLSLPKSLCGKMIDFKIWEHIGAIIRMFERLQQYCRCNRWSR